MKMKYRLLKLKQLILWWINHFDIAYMKNILWNLDGWLKRRIRMCIWEKWKKTKTKQINLTKLGISKYKAWEYTNTRKNYCRISTGPILSKPLTNNYLKDISLIYMLEIYLCKSMKNSLMLKFYEIFNTNTTKSELMNNLEQLLKLVLLIH